LYICTFKAALKQAFIDGYLTVDLFAKIKGIPEQETRREFLTVEKLNTLVATPCEYKDLKRAALFSALTGLRHCDIQKMQWKELQIDGDQARLNFTQQKTKGVEYMPISSQALELCGEPRKPNQLVFEDLPDPSWISRPLKKWLEAAGITKKITFHVARHSNFDFRLKTNELQAGFS
jgi:integrase